eukprot:jgi/Bigna1/73999/fgenesh1_pg.27_\
MYRNYASMSHPQNFRVFEDLDVGIPLRLRVLRDMRKPSPWRTWKAVSDSRGGTAPNTASSGGSLYPNFDASIGTVPLRSIRPPARAVTPGVGMGMGVGIVDSRKGLGVVGSSAPSRLKPKYRKSNRSISNKRPVFRAGTAQTRFSRSGVSRNFSAPRPAFGRQYVQEPLEESKSNVKRPTPQMKRRVSSRRTQRPATVFSSSSKSAHILEENENDSEHRRRLSSRRTQRPATVFSSSPKSAHILEENENDSELNFNEEVTKLTKLQISQKRNRRVQSASIRRVPPSHHHHHRIRPPSRQRPPPQALHLNLFNVSMDLPDTPKHARVGAEDGTRGSNTRAGDGTFSRERIRNSHVTRMGRSSKTVKKAFMPTS